VTAVDLAHDDAGEGPVVVFIHGHPFNRSMWAPQLAALRDSFRVIAPDLRGYGDSPVTAGTVPMAQLAADVRHLLDTKGIATAALAGLSMGGARGDGTRRRPAGPLVGVQLHRHHRPARHR